MFLLRQEPLGEGIFKGGGLQDRAFFYIFVKFALLKRMADNLCLSVNVFAITLSVNLSVTLFGHAIETTLA